MRMLPEITGRSANCSTDEDSRVSASRLRNAQRQSVRGRNATNGSERTSRVGRVEQALVRRHPYIACNVRMHGNLDRSSRASESTSSSEGLSARRRDVELIAGRAVEDRIVLFIGSDDSVGGKGRDGRKALCVLRDNDTVARSGPPEDSICI